MHLTDIQGAGLQLTTTLGSGSLTRTLRISWLIITTIVLIAPALRPGHRGLVQPCTPESLRIETDTVLGG